MIDVNDDDVRRMLEVEDDLQVVVAHTAPGRITVTVSDGSHSRSFGPSVDVDAVRNVTAWARQRRRARFRTRLTTTGRSGRSD